VEICNMRIALLSLAAMVVMAGAAAAQVAAPSLNPSIVLFGAPTNPGVLIWDVPSRIGGTVSKAELDSPIGSKVLDGNAKTLLATWVGQNVAVGALAERLRLSAVAPFTGAINLDANAVQAAAQFADRFSLGLGHESSHIEDTTAGGGSPEDLKLPVAGATLRLGDTVFLSLAGGTEKVAKQGVPEETRGVNRLGAAFYSRGKAGAVHLEAFREHRAASGTVEPEQTTTGFTAEALWGPVLLAYEGHKNAKKDSTGASQGEDKVSNIAVGWVPDQGLSIVLASGTLKSTDATGATQGEVKQTTVGATWLF